MPDPISTSDHSPSSDTVAALLPLDADGPALVSEDGEVISHATLRKEVDRLAEQLRSAGLGPKNRIAIVLPNGPAMALVMLAAMTVGCAAPLNPKYREDEFRFYLDDLHASAVKAAGLDDFGAPDFTERLGVLLYGLREEAGLSPFGVVTSYSQLLQLVKNRLLIQNLLTQHPEVHEVRIHQPIIIGGSPVLGPRICIT